MTAHGKRSSIRHTNGNSMLRFRCAAPGLGSYAAAPQALGNRAIDVWAFSLLADGAAVEQWRSLLSSDERHRAERFVRAPDADAFVVAHGTLRALLARYCAVAPGQLRFTRSSDGKPMLESLASAVRSIGFNLAHSANAALVAVSGGDEVGIDLECVRDDVDIDGLAARYFTGYEREMIATEAPERRVAAFFRFWVAKEAVREGARQRPRDAARRIFGALCAGRRICQRRHTHSHFLQERLWRADASGARGLARGTLRTGRLRSSDAYGVIGISCRTHACTARIASASEVTAARTTFLRSSGYRWHCPSRRSRPGSGAACRRRLQQSSSADTPPSTRPSSDRA